MSGRTGLEAADSERCSLTGWHLGGTLPSVFFLLSSPELSPRPGLWMPQAVATHEGEAHLERRYGISCGPGCCTLLLYSLAQLFEFVL
jgi:hypothetical protein